MPTDENGIKWACEPCIRGHRSTGCTHWDRYMIRVKRPGRPLSTCPHTNDSCTCLDSRVMMVKIMIDSKCFCRPDPNPDRGTEPSPTLSGSQSKEQPSTISNSSDSKQQSSSSEDALHSFSHSEVGTVFVKPAEELTGGAQPNSLSSTTHQRSGKCCSSKAAANSAAVPAAANMKSQGSGPSHGSCCGQKRTLQQGIPTATDSLVFEKEEIDSLSQPSTAVKRRRSSASSFATLRPRGGCCSSGGHTHETIVRSIQPPRKDMQKLDISQEIQYANGSLGLFHPDNNSLSSITVPGYIQYSMPGMVQDSKSSLENRFFESPYADSTIFHTAASGISYAGIQDNSMVTPSLFESDACECGNDCDCFGCPVHPFNITVRNELRELSVILEQDMAAHTLPTPNNEANTELFSSQDFLNTTPFYYGGNAQFSGISANPALRGNALRVPEYSTLELVYQQCEGRADICQCEDDCACPGCLTHGIPPVPREYNNLGLLQPDLIANHYKTTTMLDPNFLNIPDQGQQFYNQLQYFGEANVPSEAESLFDSTAPMQDSLASAKSPG